MQAQRVLLLTVFSVLLAVVPTTPAFAQDAAEPPPPPGANDACQPGQDPTPVVLVHGTFANRFINFIRIAPDLESHGYCTWALNYGCTTNSFSCGRGPIEDSAAELRDFIEEVKANTGATQVSIVGHSQGGLMPRYYIKFLGGEDEVIDLVSLSASNHGTDNPLAPFSVDCEACRQQHPYRGAFTERVNRGDETPGPIAYTQIQTRFDETVVPYYSSYLADDPANDFNGPETLRLNGPRTTNYCLQDRHPEDFSEHNTIAGDPNALAVIREALGRRGPAAPPPEADTACVRRAEEVRVGSISGRSDGDGGSGSTKPRGGVEAGRLEVARAHDAPEKNATGGAALVVAGSSLLALGVLVVRRFFFPGRDSRST
jgi:triacylglycerol lipase